MHSKVFFNKISVYYLKKKKKIPKLLVEHNLMGIKEKIYIEGHVYHLKILQYI
jgi:predicted DNA binding CopG/RHH family protein